MLLEIFYFLFWHVTIKQGCQKDQAPLFPTVSAQVGNLIKHKQTMSRGKRKSEMAIAKVVK